MPVIVPVLWVGSISKPLAPPLEQTNESCGLVVPIPTLREASIVTAAVPSTWN
jgi:hypothetical protein